MSRREVAPAMSDSAADIVFGQPTPPVIVSDFDADMARLHQIEADIKAALARAFDDAQDLERWAVDHKYGIPVSPGVPVLKTDDCQLPDWNSL